MKSLLFKLVAGAILLVVALVLIVMFVNRNDQPPSDAALKMRQIAGSAAPVADRENAYVYVMGFSAPDDADARLAGLAYVEWLRKNMTNAGTYGKPEYPGEKHHSAEAQDPQLEQFTKLCKDDIRACAEAMERDPARLQAWTQSNARLIERYDSLLDFTQWRELWPSDLPPAAPFTHVLEGQRLMLVKAWLLAGRGDAASCKRLLERDLRFWRMTLAESSSLINKVIAATAIERHFAMGNLVLRRFPHAQATRAMPDGWVEPITARERSMEKIMANEWEFADKNIGSARKAGNLAPENNDSLYEKLKAKVVGRFLLQGQATSNANAVRMLDIVKLFDLECPDIPRAYKKLQTSKEFAPKEFSDFGIYNPVGQILLSINDLEVFAKFGFRMSNLEGMRRVSVLATQLRSNNVKNENVAETLRTSVLRDPYDGNAFVWNPAEKSLEFRQSLAEKPNFRLVY